MHSADDRVHDVRSRSTISRSETVQFVLSDVLQRPGLLRQLPVRPCHQGQLVKCQSKQSIVHSSFGHVYNQGFLLFI